MERRAAEKLMRREGGNDGAGLSTAPRGDKFSRYLFFLLVFHTYIMHLN
jgi:hypothetical protein